MPKINVFSRNKYRPRLSEEPHLTFLLVQQNQKTLFRTVMYWMGTSLTEAKMTLINLFLMIFYPARASISSKFMSNAESTEYGLLVKVQGIFIRIFFKCHRKLVVWKLGITVFRIFAFVSAHFTISKVTRQGYSKEKKVYLLGERNFTWELEISRVSTKMTVFPLSLWDD